MLQVKGLSKKFSQSPLFAPLSFELHPGQVMQITGPNGVGKTTALKCMAGYLSCQADLLTFNQKPLTFQQTSFVSTDDRCFFPKLSLLENISFFKKFYGTKKNFDPLMDWLELSEHKNKAYQQCSTGIKKRLAFLRGLLKPAPLLLVDEPFANLDPAFQDKLMERLFSKEFLSQRCLVFTSNNPIDNRPDFFNIMIKKEGT